MGASSSTCWSCVQRTPSDKTLRSIQPGIGSEDLKSLLGSLNCDLIGCREISKARRSESDLPFLLSMTPPTNLQTLIPGALPETFFTGSSRSSAVHILLFRRPVDPALVLDT